MDVKETLERLSLEEKARLCVGMNFWMTQGYPEYGIRSLFLSDGPHGIRKQNVENSDHLGINASYPSVCYPTACATACTWDRQLLFELGRMLGREAKQAGVDVLLGPGVNIKRSPLCGRNFEYFSEDPYLAGEMACALIEGVQQNPVSACVKHFAANSQEYRRKAVDAVMDERTLREIYLPAFEKAVRQAGVGAVMSSYNKVNGSYPAQNEHLVKDILRGEWEFDGVLMTDWGAMDQIVPSIQAGTSLQMPADDGSGAAKLVRAVESGQLSEEALDAAVASLLRLLEKLEEGPKAQPVTAEECHAMAVKVAADSIVLLKNEGELLPLAPDEAVAVIGEMAARPRYQGAGSSHVNPCRVSAPLEEMRGRGKILFARGYEGERVSEELLEEALKAARSCQKVVLFIGLPESYESESYDRKDLAMPKDYERLVRRLSQVNPELAVVLANGSVMEMPWLPCAKAVLETNLCGEGIGEAVAQVLFGEVAPSGKLAETIVSRIEDTPAFLYTSVGPDTRDRCEYREGVFVGYRYYEKKRIAPRFPFGHGLSYTSFSYSDLSFDKNALSDGETLTVRLKVKNTGRRRGKEVVQLYVSRVQSPVPCPVKELRDFCKIDLAPGKSQTVTFTLGKRAFAYYEERLGDWYVPAGGYEILVGASSADIRLRGEVRLSPCAPWRPPVTRNTPLSDILNDEQRMRVFSEKYEELKPFMPFGLDKMDVNTDPFARGLLNNMTLHSLAAYIGGRLSDEVIEELLVQMNGAAPLSATP